MAHTVLKFIVSCLSLPNVGITGELYHVRLSKNFLLAVVAYSFNPSTQEAETDETLSLEASLVYTMSSRATWGQLSKLKIKNK